MGNRAVIEFKDYDLGIYFHWNGGRDSIESFLKIARVLKLEFNIDGFSKFSELFSKFPVSANGVKLQPLKFLDLDNYDNGVYVVYNWEIIDRKFKRNKEQFHIDQDEMFQHLLELYKIDF